MNILQTIGAGIVSVGLFFGGLFGYAPTDTPGDELGRAVNPVATNNYAIAGSGISSSATTIILTSFTAPVSGVPYTMANFGDGANAKGYLTIEPGSRTRQEIVSFTGITQNSGGSATLTGVSRGLLPFSPFTASSTYAVGHAGGSQVTVSNPPQLYDAIYSYIDNATSSGAIDGTTLAKGIYETASGIEAASTTVVGGGNTTATLVLTTLISSSTAPSSGNVVPVTKSDGNLDVSFLPDNFGSTTIRVYTATSTWSKPATSTNLKYIVVELIGGGGGGGGNTTVTSQSQSGGGGGYCKSIISWAALASTSTVAVNIGQGGAAGAGTGGAGGTGAPTRFSTFASSTGGAGGAQTGGGGAGGTGGIGQNCDLNVRGGGGGFGMGGSSFYGGGAPGVQETNAPAGGAYGGGGAGAYNITGNDLTGGAGGDGVAIITEYY